jgi:hypothetical protein
MPLVDQLPLPQQKVPSPEDVLPMHLHEGW